MPKSPKREYRSLASFEAAPNGYIVEGYATTFDMPYSFYLDYQEIMHSNALVGADMTDVIFQLNHEGMVMARTRNNTLVLEPDSHGMHIRADIGGCAQGRDLYEGIKNGLIDRMSWSFVCEEGPTGYSFDESSGTFHINKVRKVYDVSAVSVPADEDTCIAARSLIDGVIEREQQRQEMAQRRIAELDRRRRASALLGMVNV